MSALLTVENLGVTYGSGVHAVRDASIAVAEGEFVALLGANGAGKTTLLRALSGLLSHHGGRVVHGRITALGYDLVKAPGHLRSRIGITQTFEGRRILRDFSVEENLQAGAIKSETGVVRARIAELYRKFPILDQRRRQPAGLLSGGEQQILAIARALMSDPKLLLLDEPSLGLAPVMISQIAKTIRAVRELGKTVLLVEQNAHLALELADRAYVMQNGAIVAEGLAEDLKRQEMMQHFYIGLGEASLPLRRRPEIRSGV
ncbi:ABC-type branched-subunit amino acid transport system ATPase component [Rhodoligotrophos appendicifer]|uniref:ABC transporter ATP-binding protein n=1 Tax=Rhodoligotrophos appendicifer TaxID=987056 RepID=UPI001186912A|nr:ABC transporter ATP-binding protein [Rhodoligotrophos appendicifer]